MSRPSFTEADWTAIAAVPMQADMRQALRLCVEALIASHPDPDRIRKQWDSGRLDVVREGDIYGRFRALRAAWAVLGEIDQEAACR